MGQKVHPTGLRIGIVESWRSRWYARKKDFGDYLVEDQKIRKHIAKRFRFAGIPKVEIERTANDVTCIIHTAKPGVVIGRKGQKVDELRKELEALTGNKKVNINIVELNRPELSAQLVAESIAEQLEKRSSFRRTMKKAVDLTMAAGAKGCRVKVGGRLGGAEMARRETQMTGSIPLSTLRAAIDYGFATAVTVYGSIGVKVWIYLDDKRTEASHGAYAKARQASKRAKR
ncbi:30S ribosomal protein S3 [Planctomycetota bacterium]